MYCGWQIIGVIFFKQPGFTPQTRYSFFELAITEGQRARPPPVCCHAHRQKGQWGVTVKRHKARWVSSSKVQSDSGEAHLCLSPTVCLYLWLWVRAGQYTEILRLCLISTGAGVGKGLQWPWGNTDPRVKKTGRKSHGPFIVAGSKSTGREKRGSVLKSALSTLNFFMALMQSVRRHAWRLARFGLQHQDHHRRSRASKRKTACSEIPLLLVSRWKQWL